MPPKEFPTASTKTTPTGRRLAALLRDVLATETFDTLADLTETLKRRCLRLKIPWTNDAISEAFRLVGSNRPLTTVDVRAANHVRRRRVVELTDQEVAVSKADARAILLQLGYKL